MGSFIISSPALAVPAELAPDLLVLIERGRRSLGLPRSHRLAQLLDDLEELATGSVVVKESVTAARAAAELGVSPRRMRQLAERSELGAERRGGRWFLRRAGGEGARREFRLLPVPDRSLPTASSEAAVPVQSL